MTNAALDYEVIGAAFADLGGSDMVDPNDEYGTDTIYSSESLEDWVQSSKTWCEYATFERGEVNGMSYLRWEGAQSVKGQRRRDVIVVQVSPDTIAIQA